ncbi:MAG TPA: TonB-dependent receptor [Bryocella sp.]|nr:TonB-dependent receptor [Bryocella sp.]
MSTLAAIVVFAIALTMQAQTTTGTIYGTVTDSSGAAIPGCTVKVVDTATGVAQTIVTNGSGAYTFPTVEPGDYRVSTTAAGFKSLTQTGVQVAANQNVHVAFALPVGSATENVSVVAGVTMVDTREAQIATTIEQQELQELPSLNRDVYSLVATVPGVTNYSGAPLTGDVSGTSFSANGLPANMVSFYLDGAYNNVYKNGAGGNAVPNPDALEEFHLVTSNFDAEFGRTPSAVVNVITRSGTRNFHGEAYDYIRNDMFNAKNYFADSVTPLKQNQFGANLGGPLLKHGDAFFFLDYEGTIQHSPANIFSTVITTPTALERSGDFRQSPVLPLNVSCNGVQYVICPSAFDPVAVNLLKFVPVADAVSHHPAQQSGNGNDLVNQGTARVDYHGFQSHSIELMFFTQRGTQNTPNAGGNQIFSYTGMIDKEIQDNIVAADTWILSPHTVNSFRAFYTQNRYIQGNGTNYTLADLGSQAAEGGPAFSPPTFTVNGNWQMGTGANGKNDVDQQAYGAFDTVNLTRGHHDIKLGGSYVWEKYAANGNKTAGGNFTFTGAATGAVVKGKMVNGNPIADFLLGKANTMLQTSSSIQRQYSYDPALYIQDDWQIRPRLNVNVGLRWEVFPPFPGGGGVRYGTFAPNVQSKVVPNAPLGLLFGGDPGIPAGVYATSWTRFAPRVGFAFDMFGNGRTSLRAGYGVFYFDQAEIQTGMQLQQPYVASITLNKPYLPYVAGATSNQPPNLVNPYAPNPDPFPFVYDPANPKFVSGTTIFAVPTDGGSVPYVEEYNLNVQQQLTPNFSMQIGYVGNATRKDYLQHDINAPVYAPGASTTAAGINARRPYHPTPSTYTYQAIQLNDNVNNSTYNSLQATLRGRVGKKFTTRLSYVWAKSLGYSGPIVDNSDISKDYGPLAIDIRNRFVASYTYLFPEIRRFGAFGREAINGWHISGITAFSSGNPFTVTSSVDTNLDGTNNDRADVVGDPYFSNSRSRAQKIQQFINPAAFAVPDGPYGNEQQRSLVGPGNVNTNLALFKEFPIHENLRLLFRAEAFNAFGNVNLNNPKTGLTPLNANAALPPAQQSQITGAADARIWQFAAKLRF